MDPTVQMMHDPNMMASNMGTLPQQQQQQVQQQQMMDQYGSNDGGHMQGQKRQAGYDQHGQAKRMRIGKIDLRILLPSKDAGAIIGRAGANIKKLRQDHKTIIQIPDCEGPERLLFIGGELDPALDTVLAVIPLLEDNKKYTNMDFTTELRMLVHQSQAGCIIGRGGEKIKELRLKHNLDMKVYPECAPLSTERTCQMRGKPRDIVECMRDVIYLLETAPPKGMSRPYDPMNYNEFLASQYGGYVTETRRGGSGGMGGGRGGARGGDRPGRGGDRDQRGSGRDGDRRMGRGSSGSGGRGGQGANMNFGGNMMNQFQNQSGPVTTNQVTIPNDLAGVIIGPRGSKLAQLREQSGADISIDKQVTSTNDRIITITGTQEQIQNAQYLLQMTVKQSGLWNGNQGQ